MIHRARTAVYPTPVNILGKYDNLVEKSMHFVCPGTKISQQMLESPLSSLNKQLNWTDLLIIYRIESQGATAFVGDTDSICPLTERFCVSPLVELVGQINQKFAYGFYF